jgi:hypothetical protein
VITPARPVELRFLCNGGELSLYVSSKQVKKIGRIFRNSVKTDGIGPVQIPKPTDLLFTVSKIQKKIKVSKKYVKKLDQILRLLMKKFL